MQGDMEEAIRQVLDPHLDKRFNTKRQDQVVAEMMRLMGLRRTIKRPKRSCVVAVPTKDGDVVARKVKPVPTGYIPGIKVDGVTVAKPTAGKPDGGR